MPCSPVCFTMLSTPLPPAAAMLSSYSPKTSKQRPAAAAADLMLTVLAATHRAMAMTTPMLPMRVVVGVGVPMPSPPLSLPPPPRRLHLSCLASSHNTMISARGMGTPAPRSSCSFRPWPSRMFWQVSIGLPVGRAMLAEQQALLSFSASAQLSVLLHSRRLNRIDVRSKLFLSVPAWSLF